MNTHQEGMNYAPKGKPAPVVKPGEFKFSVIALDHGHIYGMCNGLIEAGATLKAVYDKDPAKVEAFIKTFPRPRRLKARRRSSGIRRWLWWPPPPSRTCARLWASAS